MLKEVYDNYCLDKRELDYKSEVKEFYYASTTAERLDALVQCSWARMWDMCKIGNSCGDVNKLTYSKSVESLMVSVIVEEIGQNMFDKVIRLAEDIVCEHDTGSVKKIENMIQEQQELQAAIEDAHAKKQEEIFRANGGKYEEEEC